MGGTRGLGGSSETCFLLALSLELPIQLRVTGMCSLNTEHPGPKYERQRDTCFNPIYSDMGDRIPNSANKYGDLFASDIYHSRKPSGLVLERII
jgi:hypothetical protein